MRMTAVFLLLLTLFTAGTVRAAPSEQTLACVAASTDGQTLRDEGRLLEARARFSECAQARCPAIVAQSCTGWLAELEQRIPTVTLRVRGIPRELSIDGQSVANDGVPIALEPGQHRLHARDLEGREVELAFEVAERERDKQVELQLPSEPEPASRAPGAELPLAVPAHAPLSEAHFHTPLAAWMLGGLGVAGVGTFAGLRVKAANYLNDLQHSCAPMCRQQQSDHGKRIALAADISLGVGVAALAGAAVWTLGSAMYQRRRRDSAFVLSPMRTGVNAVWSVRY